VGDLGRLADHGLVTRARMLKRRELRIVAMLLPDISFLSLCVAWRRSRECCLIDANRCCV
jgi:hypothetical protein